MFFMGLFKKLSRARRIPFIILLAAYKSILSPHIGGGCRFEPSCSDYAADCLHKHSLFNALALIAKRLLKCHPWGPFGFDPVPETKDLAR